MMSESGRMAARVVLIGFDGLEPPSEAREVLRRGVSQVILFNRNLGPGGTDVAATCRAIHAAAGEPVAIAVDQEGGRVARLSAAHGLTPVPPMRQIGALGPTAGPLESARVGAQLARELRALGVGIDFAPVVDVDSNPANPVIGDRSFSDDPTQAARCAASFITALQAGGVAACAKHFPGHGDTDTDSHLTLPRLRHGLARLEQIELPPFAAAIAAGVASIMTAHVVFEAIDPRAPATMSHAVVTGLLRQKLGFNGLIYSDCLEMQAISDGWETGAASVASIAAGCDTVLVCHRHDRQHAAIDALDREAARSSTFAHRLREAAARVDALLARVR